MPSSAVTLGIDLGSSGTKAVLLDPAVGVVASASRPVALSSPHPGWAEADTRVWWDNLKALVPELLHISGRTAADVAGVACSGMVPAVVLLDEHQQPLGPALLQNDARATAEIAELQDELSSVDLLASTGSMLTQQSVAPTIRWQQRHDSTRWSHTAIVAGSYDWMAMALGARPHVERNWGLESGLFDFEGHRVPEVWRAVSIDADRIPALEGSGSVVGEVSHEASVATGLNSGTPIVVGGADHVLSAFGAGLVGEGDWLIKLGGAGDILAVSDVKRLDPRLYLDAHPMNGLWLPNGCMATSGSLLRWLQALFGGVELVTLDDEAQREAPADLLCLPYFLGEKSPHHDPDRRGAFVGLHLGTTRGAMYRSALEAIAYGFRQHSEIFAELGMSLGDPRVTNGGSKSTLWKQILADVLQRPLVPVIDHPGASLGAAIAAAIGVQVFESWESVNELVRTGPAIEPQSDNFAAYEEGYSLYTKLDTAIKPLSHALARKGRP